MIKKLVAIMLTALIALIVGFNIWGAATLGSMEPAANAERDPTANKVVMVFGATGSAGGGLVKAAIEDTEVDTVYVVTRRTTEYLDSVKNSAKVSIIMHKDFTDYSAITDQLSETTTVLWALGKSSLQVDEATYTLIHVDFPAAFMPTWLAARKQAGAINAPMSWHFIAGMGTEDSDAPWAHDKRKTERNMAALAEGTGLRVFSYRSAYIRPVSETTNAGHHITEALLRPGSLVTSSKELGQAMLEISARTKELPNGSLLDNADSLAYTKAYQQQHQIK
ncbi:hypothetical protein [Oceanicoccus sagamiensis]|uniref:NAD(P)-binding domain-containing protein n=1 Tax=Oceanicoccus sagamiensis TaxID=716816 RepID=A0A1X9NG21_9GAMM|nr:hypothetical protein [Oceanicoccus sagamiensis]ARN72953.1 hypothetical protein BST96_01825 [Oceanicoccus sagamiensis]